MNKPARPTKKSLPARKQLTLVIVQPQPGQQHPPLDLARFEQLLDRIQLIKQKYPQLFQD